MIENKGVGLQWHAAWTTWQHEDEPNVTDRPIVICRYHKSADVYRCLKVTTTKRKENTAYEIIEWQHANLSEPSWIRCSQSKDFTNLEIDYLFNRLHPRDITGLKNLLVKHRLAGFGTR